MDCLFINPDKKLDKLVRLGLDHTEITIHHLKTVGEFIGLGDYNEYRLGVVFIHLDTILRSLKAIREKFMHPMIYTVIITGHEERPPEGEFIWDSNVFTLKGAIEMFEDIVLTGFEYLSSRSRREIFDKFELFGFPLTDDHWIRLKGHDIIIIREDSNGLQVTTKQGIYTSSHDMSFFHNIHLLPDFVFVSPRMIINTNMVKGINNDTISLNNGTSVKLAEEFRQEFWRTMELPSGKFYFRTKIYSFDQ